MRREEFLQPASAVRAIEWFRGEPRWWLASVVAVMALAALARVLLYQRFPVFITNDSPDYLLAAERIAAEGDFMNQWLRDWRLPGYPVFLALLKRVVAWSSASIMVAQSFAGVLGVALGLVAGRSLGWRPGSIVLGLFLALNPVYLLNEHAVMAEALFIVLLWSVTTLAIVALGRRPGAVAGLLLGLLFSSCVLTRSNGLFFCLPVVAGLVGLSQVRQGAGRARLASLVPFALGMLLAVGALQGLWAYRNYLYLGKPRAFTHNVQRNLLIYQAQHGLIDPELPAIRRFQFDAGSANDSVYRLVQEQLDPSDSSAAERVAGRIVREQVSEQKRAYLRQVGYSLRHFGGLPIPTSTLGRDDMKVWFQHYLRDPLRLHTHNVSLLAGLPDFVYVASGRRGRLFRWWRGAGGAYLSWGRGLLTIVFGLAGIVFVLSGGLKGEDHADAALLAVFLSLLATAAAHAVLLADYDRFATPFDGFQMLVIVGVAERALRRRRADGRPEVSPRNRCD